MSSSLVSLEQPALFESEDSALLFGEAECRKRYTAEQAKQIAWKRNAIVMLLGAMVPVEDIARELHVNTRTVNALARQDASRVAGFTKQYADALLRKGAEGFALASTKMADASYLQLVTGAGILTDKAVLLSQMGQEGEEKVVKEEQDHAQAAAELRRLMAETAGSSDSDSIDKPTLSEGFEASPAVDAVGAADGPASRVP